ncbi:MAG: Rrf2 family transcriptional regulator [Deltaproteobacteria bacterium]|nr:Rrf2 family transcriptional regulator [Deltaproteobacteria bacterium]PWB64227.1 MAG: Rrf2 family transcriptional regulator [Deltaproteobacteria bacterium]
MRLSKKAEYGLRALIYAARFPEGTTFQIKDLADKNRIPKKFLELILLELKNAGILRSRRGVGGGYLLGRRPDAIRSSEILRAVEGPVSPARSDKGKGEPEAEDASPAVARLVKEVSEAIESVLDRWTLADLAREEQEVAERKRRHVMYFI